MREYVVVKREPLYEKVCPVCGKPFEGLSRRRYCSQPCLQRASYLRHADKRRADRRQRYRRERQRRDN